MHYSMVELGVNAHHNNHTMRRFLINNLDFLLDRQDHPGVHYHNRDLLYGVYIDPLHHIVDYGDVLDR